jgi:hypothetical protein
MHKTGCRPVERRLFGVNGSMSGVKLSVVFRILLYLSALQLVNIDNGAFDFRRG